MPFKPNFCSSQKISNFGPLFCVSSAVLAPPQLTKKSEGKNVVKENEDLESAMAAQISQPDLPGRAPKLQVKRKFVAPADSTEEDTPSKQRRTGGIKRPAVKPAAAKKLIKSASPSESTSAMETQIPPNKTEDVSPKLDQVEENIAASDEGDSATIPTKSGNGSSPATK
ncbi:hypothetical protein SLEP1_g16598, partial [Rubroshorea leprosula]